MHINHSTYCSTRNSCVRKRYDSAKIKEMAGNIQKMTKNDQNETNNSPSPVNWTRHDNISCTSARKLSSFDCKRTIYLHKCNRLIKIGIKDMCVFCAILKTWKHEVPLLALRTSISPLHRPRKLDSGDKRNIKVDFPLESVVLRCTTSIPDKNVIHCIRYFSGWVFHLHKNVK